MADPHILPEQVGRYTIERFLGQGGMGRLYLAVDPVIGRRLAIKLIRDGTVDTDARARFMQEARAGGGLKHPNVVTVFDAGDHQGHPFIAMEYVSGETLADLIRRAQPVPVATKLHLIEQLCRGLACAHRHELVHRDIKPANLMVDDEGTLKILDFGIARVAESRLTSTGVALGTVNYMSPEQVAGDTVDYRSDVFSVGVVFYELLTYQPAFPGTLRDGVMYRIVHGEPVSLRHACPDLDPSITQTVERAMRVKPGERYQDLDTMADELGAIRQRLGLDVAANAMPGTELETSVTLSSASAVRRTPPAPPSLPPGNRAALRHARQASESDLESTETRQQPTDVATGRRRPSWMWAAGAAALLVAAVAILDPRRSGPLDVDPGAFASATPVPDPDQTEPSTPVPRVMESREARTAPVEPGDQRPTPGPDSLPAPTSDPPRTATPAVDASRDSPPTRDRLAELRQQAVAAYIQGDREVSLRAAASVLQLVPDDTDTEQVLDRLQQDALDGAQLARESVDRLGQTSPLYEQAQRAETDAEDLLGAGQRESAIRRLWTADVLFRQAAETVGRGAESGSRGGTATQPQPGRPSGPDDQADPARVSSAGPPPVPPALDGAVLDGSDATAARDLAAIADTLDRYRTALAQLDGTALERVYPAVPRDTITALRDYDAYEAAMSNLATQVDGDIATVSSRLSLTMKARTGVTAQASGPVVFRLEKRSPTEWLIVSIDMSRVR